MAQAMFKVVGVKSEDNILHCPICNEQNLHHTSVEVFTRHEDDLTTLVTVVGPAGKTSVGSVDSDQCLNPSSRRDGLRIHFICEHCHGGKVLEIAQHKGCTLVEWRI